MVAVTILRRNIGVSREMGFIGKRSYWKTIGLPHRGVKGVQDYLHYRQNWCLVAIKNVSDLSVIGHRH